MKRREEGDRKRSVRTRAAREKEMDWQTVRMLTLFSEWEELATSATQRPEETPLGVSDRK